MAIKLKFRQSDRAKKNIRKNTVNMPLNLDGATFSLVKEFADKSELSLNQAIVVLLERWRKNHTKRKRSRRNKYNEQI